LSGIVGVVAAVAVAVARGRDHGHVLDDGFGERLYDAAARRDGDAHDSVVARRRGVHRGAAPLSVHHCTFRVAGSSGGRARGSADVLNARHPPRSAALQRATQNVQLRRQRAEYALGVACCGDGAAQLSEHRRRARHGTATTDSSKLLLLSLLLLQLLLW
jgi:hypothetical protein